MSTSAVSLFLALLAVVAQVAVVVVVVLLVGGRFSPALARWREAFTDAISADALTLALCVAVVATAGSLYFSEVADFTPCKLCWYQRIAMYPLVPMLAIAAWRRDTGIRPYVAVIAALGGAVSVYHVLVERLPELESSTCDPENPCSLIWIERFGYLTIPAMALSAFALILALMAVARPGRDQQEGAV